MWHNLLHSLSHRVPLNPRPQHFVILCPFVWAILWVNFYFSNKYSTAAHTVNKYWARAKFQHKDNILLLALMYALDYVRALYHLTAFEYIKKPAQKVKTDKYFIIDKRQIDCHCWKLQILCLMHIWVQTLVTIKAKQIWAKLNGSCSSWRLRRNSKAGSGSRHSVQRANMHDNSVKFS